MPVQHREEIGNEGGFGNTRIPVIHPFHNAASGNNSFLLQVLRDRDLATAGNLFLVRNENLGDMHEALIEIEMILKHGGYRLNKNDQSIVEICITRITTAIRDTRQAEYFASELTKVLNACVLQAAVDEFSPHAKVASDICNCLFTLCHDKRRVMELALPVGIKLLFNNHNSSYYKQGILAKNMTSYVVLAAATNADVIARYASQLTEAVIKGNVALLRILPQIYSYNPTAIHAHLPAIVRTITRCTAVEKDALLALLDASFNFISERLAYETATTLLHQLSAAAPALANDIFPVLRRFCLAHPNIVTQLLGDTYRLPDIEVYRAAQELFLNYNNDSYNSISNYATSNGMQTQPSYYYPEQQQQQSYNYNMMMQSEHAITDVRSNFAAPVWNSNFISHANLLPALGHVASMNYSGGVSANYGGNSNNLERFTTTQRNSRNSLGQLKFGNAVSANTTSRERLRTAAENNHPSSSTTWFPSSTYVFDNNTRTEALSNYTRPSAQQVAFSMANNLGGGGGDSGWGSDLKVAGRVNIRSIKPTIIGATSQSASSLTSTKKNGVGSSRARRRNKNNETEAGNIRGKTRSLSRLTKTLSRNMLTNSNGGGRLRSSTGDLTTRGELTHCTDEQLLQMMPRNRLAKRNSSGNNDAAGSAAEMSHVINPVLHQDAMQQFCERNMQKIKAYVSSILVKYPLPYKCVVEETPKGRKQCKLCFQCQKRTAACLYATPQRAFTLQSSIADIWLHLMFLALQAKSSHHQRALGQQDAPVHSLKMTYEHLGLNSSNSEKSSTSFAQLATSAFPNAQKLELLLRELKQARYFQVFQYNGLEKRWCCFLCNDMALVDKFRSAAEQHEGGGNDKFLSLRNSNNSVVTCEGLLKQFHRSRLLGVQRWKSRYFSLRGRSLQSNHLNHSDSHSDHNNELDIGTIKCIRIIGAASAATSPADNYDEVEEMNFSAAAAAAELREYEADERREAKNHGKCFGFSSFSQKSDDEDEKFNEQQNQSLRKVLEIVTADDRVMLLQAPDRATAEKWLMKIKMALIKHQLGQNGHNSNNSAMSDSNRNVNRASSEDVVDGFHDAVIPASDVLRSGEQLVHTYQNGSGRSKTSSSTIKQQKRDEGKNSSVSSNRSSAVGNFDRNSNSRRSYVVRRHYTSSDV